MRVMLACAMLTAACAPRNLRTLEGTWTLVAADDLNPDGTREPAYGASPRGILIVDGEGRYSLQLFRGEHQRFASGDKRRGTSAEYEAAVLRMSSHYGRCSIEPDGETLSFRIEEASFPNWIGTEQRRKFELQGDQLSYQIPLAASGTGKVPISVWRRVNHSSFRAGSSP